MTICQYQISGNDQILPQAHMRLWEAHALPYPITSSRRKKKPARHSMTRRRLSKNRSGRFGGPQPSKCNPNPATCAADSGLAAQGFLALFPAREAHRAERETVQILGKGRRRRTFSTRCGAPFHDAPVRLPKTLPGGLEGRSSPNTIRIRRHVRRIRNPCCARIPCAVSRPGVPQGREGNSAKIRKRTPQADFFDALTGPLPAPARQAAARRSRRNSRPARAERCSCRCPPG